jgi:hypothetical protein
VVDLVDTMLARGTGSDGELIVLLSGPSGRRELVWPPGYGVRTYRFGGDFDIVDPGGAAVHGEGDAIDRACLAGSPGDPDAVLLLAPRG